MTRPLVWLGKRLACITLAGAGAALVLFAYSRIATADITNGDNLGKYTYPSSDCHENEDEAGDPINVLFWDDAAGVNLDYYFDLYHGWGDNDGETQYFQTWGWCSEMDGQPSSGGLQMTRYHARYSRGLDATGEVIYDDPIWGDYSVAAAHYEQWVPYAPEFNDCDGGTWPFQGDHAVPPDGFNQGRDNVIENWLIEPDPGHTLWGYGYWDNRESRLQCTRQRAASDGEVAFIQVYLDSDGDGIDDADEHNVYGTDPLNPDTDGDGCSEGYEVGIGFAPLNPWDVYDVPVPANPDETPNGERNGVVDIGDALAVLFYSFAQDNSGPNGNGVDYDSLKDGDWTGPAVMYPDGSTDAFDETGRRYDRTPGPLPNPPNDAGPPNGVVNISDVLAALAQAFIVDCPGPPEELDRLDSGRVGEGGALSSAPNAMAVDALPGGGVDSARTVKGTGPFDVDIAITAAKNPYSGYQFVLSYDDQVLALLPTTDVDRDGTLESWTYSRLSGATLDAEVVQRDLDRDAALDQAAGGSVLLSGAASATGVIATVRFQCVGNGASPIHLVAPGEGSLSTTTLAQGGAAIDTSVADAWITCSVK